MLSVEHKSSLSVSCVVLSCVVSCFRHALLHFGICRFPQEVFSGSRTEIKLLKSVRNRIFHSFEKSLFY